MDRFHQLKSGAWIDLEAVRVVNTTNVRNGERAGDILVLHADVQIVMEGMPHMLEIPTFLQHDTKKDQPPLSEQRRGMQEQVDKMRDDLANVLNLYHARKELLTARNVEEDAKAKDDTETCQCSERARAVAGPPFKSMGGLTFCRACGKRIRTDSEQTHQPT